MAIKIPFLAEVRDFLRGTKDVEDALEDVSHALDDLTRQDTEVTLSLDSTVENDLKDIGAEAKTQAEKVETSFTDSFNELKRQGRTAGRAINKALKDGAEQDPLRAHDVFKADLKAELVSNMVESGAEMARGLKDGFDAEDVSTIVDGVSDTIAQVGALGGPLGAAGGLAAASAMQLLVGPALEQAKQDAKEYQDTFTEAFGNIVEAGAEMGRELTIQSTVEKLVQNTEKLNEANETAKELGISVGVVLRAMAGDADALAVAQDAVADSERDIADARKATGDATTDLTAAVTDAGTVFDETKTARDELNAAEAQGRNTLEKLSGEYTNHASALDAAAESAKAKGEADEFAAGKAVTLAQKTAASTGKAQELEVTLDGVTTSLRVMPDGKVIKVTDDGTAALTQGQINAITGKTVEVGVKLTPANQTMSDYLSGKLFQNQTVTVTPRAPRPKLGRMVPQ